MGHLRNISTGVSGSVAIRHMAGCTLMTECCAIGSVVMAQRSTVTHCQQ